MFSTDYPYQFRPNSGARTFLEKAILSPEEKEKIAHLNWERLFEGSGLRMIKPLRLVGQVVNLPPVLGPVISKHSAAHRRWTSIAICDEGKISRRFSDEQSNRDLGCFFRIHSEANKTCNAPQSPNRARK